MGDSVLVDMMTGALSDPFDKVHMGVTAENVAAKYSISRAEQDALALASHNRAEAAIQAGLADQVGTSRDALAALGQQLAMATGRALVRRSASLSAAQLPATTLSSHLEAPMNDQASISPSTADQEDRAVAKPQHEPQTLPPDEAAITAQVEARLRRQLAELTEIAAQAKRLGVSVDPAQALARGVTPDALRQTVLKQAAERDVAEDVVAQAPTQSATPSQSTSVADSKLVKAAQAYGDRQ